MGKGKKKKAKGSYGQVWADKVAKGEVEVNADDQSVVMNLDRSREGMGTTIPLEVDNGKGITVIDPKSELKELFLTEGESASSMKRGKMVNHPVGDVDEAVAGQLGDKGVILRGKSGLFISYNDKLFFPEKSFEDACEGLVENLRVVKDCGNFGFFVGEMVSSPELSLLGDARSEFMKASYCHKATYYNVAIDPLNDTDLPVHLLLEETRDDKAADYANLYYKGGLWCKLNRYSAKFIEERYGVQSDIYAYLLYHRNLSDASLVDRFGDNLVSTVFGFMQTLSGKRKNFVDIANMKVLIWKGIMYIDRTKSYVTYSDDGGIKEYFVKEGNMELWLRQQLGNPKVSLGSEDFIKWAKENNVSLGLSLLADSSNGLIKRTFYYEMSDVNGEKPKYELVVFGGKGFRTNYLQKDKIEQVKESVDGLIAWRNRLCKGLTAKNAHYMSKLTSRINDFMGYTFI